MTNLTPFRLDTVDLATEFGWETQHILRMDEFTKDDVTIVVQYSPDDAIISIARSRPGRPDESFGADSAGKEEWLRIWLTGRAEPVVQVLPRKVTTATGDKAPRLRWSVEGWFHRRTGEVAGTADPRVPKTQTESEKQRDWMLTGSQANVVGGCYRRDLDQNSGQSAHPVYTATWHPDGGRVVELGRTDGLKAYFACVRHHQSNWPRRVAGRSSEVLPR